MSTRRNIVNTGLELKNIELNNSIIDGEYLGESNSDDFRFLAFDCLVYQGNDVTNLPLIERRKLLESFKDAFNPIEGSVALKFQLKKFLIAGVDIGPNREYPNLFAACDKVLETKHDYMLDGLILYSLGDYRSDTYKWKDNDTNSIDFKLSWNPQLDLSNLREKSVIDVILSVQIKRADYQSNKWIKIPKGYSEMYPSENTSNWTFPIPFSQERYPNLYECKIEISRIEKVDGEIKLFVKNFNGDEIELVNRNIYEMLYMKESDNQWKIMRHRYDKQFPNGFTTASNVWSTIVLLLPRR